ncbi:type I methionyl aminopeptidase [Candidatus Peregrinibacteria bacterium CG_4_10_14_0_2_um_filter_38_24]|nr:MAG: type I methionyl aminopeptidase [Candidatus Peregrinibacteria bacterium CG_4_10_14_0_2_um_filter_38_24]PJC38630.1 MAG: type I methionyl aminopeptidase [Candidatus Peregrinibacteria bacterium CG_4_9_14_0_2_um_filter_38_9]
MNIPIKTPEEIEFMQIGGKVLAQTLDEVLRYAKIGISTTELDKIAEDFIRSKGMIPGFKGFHGFPATLCTAVNEVVVHGIPRKDEFLKDGDLLTIDCGVLHQGFYTDAARSIAIGNASKEKIRLIKTAKMALDRAIAIAGPGIHVGEISIVIEKTIEDAGFKVIHNLTGHGVGRGLHEEPTIFNFWDGNKGPTLKPGMTIAIEPIFSISASEIITLKDNWTIITKDRSCAVQEENTILITESGSEILTTQ